MPGRWAAFATVSESVCLEGAVADGRARGEGGAGGRAGAAMIMHHALVCSKRSSGSSSCSRQAGSRQAGKEGCLSVDEILLL